MTDRERLALDTALLLLAPLLAVPWLVWCAWCAICDWLEVRGG